MGRIVCEGVQKHLWNTIVQTSHLTQEIPRGDTRLKLQLDDSQEKERGKEPLSEN